MYRIGENRIHVKCEWSNSKMSAIWWNTGGSTRIRNLTTRVRPPAFLRIADIREWLYSRATCVLRFSPVWQVVLQRWWFHEASTTDAYRLLTPVNDFRHTLPGYGWAFLVDDFMHTSHGYGFSPLCGRQCTAKVLFCVKRFIAHVTHAIVSRLFYCY